MVGGRTVVVGGIVVVASVVVVAKSDIIKCLQICTNMSGSRIPFLI